jgi:hypothetical protein
MQLAMSRWSKKFTAVVVLLSIEVSVCLFAGIFASTLVEANHFELVSAEQSDNAFVLTHDTGVAPYGLRADEDVGRQNIVIALFFSRAVIIAKVSRYISHSVLIL